jgi:hypothetical protein
VVPTTAALVAVHVAAVLAVALAAVEASVVVLTAVDRAAVEASAVVLTAVVPLVEVVVHTVAVAHVVASADTDKID